MSDLALTMKSPLGDLHREFNGVTLTELTGFGLVSIATPLGGEGSLAKAVESAFGVSLPSICSSSYCERRKARFLGLQRDQMFLLFEHGGSDAVKTVKENLGEAGYYTDQSDSWAILRTSGPAIRAALQRICMLDLNPETFEVGDVSSTTMEHLNVIILRDSPDSFLLMSPRSSADSFLHAIETSIFNTT